MRDDGLVRFVVARSQHSAERSLVAADLGDLDQSMVRRTLNRMGRASSGDPRRDLTDLGLAPAAGDKVFLAAVLLFGRRAARPETPTLNLVRRQTFDEGSTLGERVQVFNLI